MPSAIQISIFLVILLEMISNSNYDYKNIFKKTKEPRVQGRAYWTVGRKGARLLKEIEVKVFDNDLEKAMRVLKKKIQNDGLFKRLKLKKSFEKPSEFRRRKQREAQRRRRIAEIKKKRRYPA